MQLTDNDKQQLLSLARSSISHGLKTLKPLPLALSDYNATLQQQAACFVTLHKQGRLRGCIGHLQAIQALVKDVSDNAFAAAFQDPRFKAVTDEELAQLHIEISVLTPAVPMSFDSEADLIGQLEVGKDGLILEDGRHRGTFLPSVWESLNTPQIFWENLKLKAGLPTNHWSQTLKVSRYTTLAFAE